MAGVRRRIVFCDFDGTITATETFVAVLKRFAPERSAELLPEIYARRLTLREGVRQMMESIPSAEYFNIVDFTRPQAIRPGLSEFLHFLKQHEVPFVVVSGGLRGMVEAVLAPYLADVAAIHAMEADTREPYLRVWSPVEGEVELVDKVKVVQQYDVDEAIAIGDSITDLNLALYADVVFARDRLADYLDEAHKPYQHWHDFVDVRTTLATLWNLATG